MNQEAHSAGWPTRLFAFAGFLVSLVTFYFALWKPACVRIGLGPQAFIASKPRVGVLATLANDGANGIIITSGELTLDDAGLKLPLTTIAIQSESWEYDDEGNQQKVSPFRYSFFTPFAIKPHDETSTVMWFVAPKSFPLGAGKHKAMMVIEDSKQHRISAMFEIELGQSDVEALYEKKKGKEQAGIEYPITIIPQQGGEYCPLF
ncbi:MAG TPA: hypothetical protein VG051_02575 [Candidatus Acidoferrum sp.]|nr:hypothetical protein [Candidatus Acidoferrum sp.]